MISYILSLLTILIQSLPKSVQGKPCTLCKDSNVIPNPNGQIGGQSSCRNESMIAMFYNDKSIECQQLRSDAKYACGCEFSNAPSHAPLVIEMPKKKCHICPNGDTLTDKYSSQKVTVNQTCLELAAEALLYEANSNDCLNRFQPVGISKCGCSNEKGSGKATFSTTNTDLLSESSNVSPTALLVGFSVLIILAGFISIFLLRKKIKDKESLCNANKKSDQENDKKTVHVVWNKTDLSYVELEEGSNNVSDSQLFEYRDVLSVESTIISKSMSCDSVDKGENNNHEVNYCFRQHQPMTIFRMDEYSEVKSFDYDDEQSFTRFQIDEFSEVLPYDEASESPIKLVNRNGKD